VAIGERLREARMRQKIDIAEVESATKIRAKYLRALENEEFSLLPGNTFVKTFLRTYAEYLGLDSQLLIEEYRVDYEPRGENELQPMVSRPNRRAERRPRPSRGPPGPGTAIIVVAVAILAILAVLGLTGGNGGGGGSGSGATTAKQATKKKHKKKKHKAAPPPKPTTVRLKIAPTGPTYLCVDRGVGTPILFNTTTSSPQSFKGKHLRVNIGNAANTRIFSNGKKVSLTTQAVTIGYDFTPTKSKPLPAGQRRPCA
jgi:transcriptional regulator with XRE-family HTH domain